MNETTTLVTDEAVDVSELDTAKPLELVFQPYQTMLSKWEAKANALVVTDINQKTEMAQARLARLELREARVTMEKTRKGLVEGLKARTGKIDTFARLIRQKMESLEDTLLLSEQFADRHAAKLKSELKSKREAELAPFIESAIIVDLSVLSEDDFAKTLADAKAMKQAKLDAISKAEAERKAKEEADRKERERIELENRKLKAEAEEREKLAAAERKRIEAEREAERKKLKAEADALAEANRKEKERIESENAKAAAAAAEVARKLKAELDAKAKVEADQKAKELATQNANKEAQRKAAAAPDNDKLKALVDSIRKMPLPELNNKEVETTIKAQTEKFAGWVESKIV